MDRNLFQPVRSRLLSVGRYTDDKWFASAYAVPVFSFDALTRWKASGSDAYVHWQPGTHNGQALRRHVVKTVCQMEVVRTVTVTSAIGK
jgi:hypothetical protein